MMTTLSSLPVRKISILLVLSVFLMIILKGIPVPLLKRDIMLQVEREDIPQSSAGLQGKNKGSIQNKTFEIDLRNGIQKALMVPNLGRKIDTQDKVSWKEMMQRRFEERRNHLQERCASFSGHFPENLNDQIHFSNFHYIKKYKLFVFLTPKGASTTWRVHLEKIAGISNKRGQSPTSAKLLNQIRTLTYMNMEEMMAKMMLDSSMCVISVRHPLTRLVSAYRHKFGGGATIQRKSGVLLSEVAEALKLEGAKHVVEKKRSVTFRQFLNHVINKSKQGLSEVNTHWRPVTLMTRPCTYPYKYIIKYETLTDDLRYFFYDTLGVRDKLNLGTHKNVHDDRPKKDDYNDYYKKLPKALLHDIYQFYRYDFELLGYEVPEYIKNVLV